MNVESVADQPLVTLPQILSVACRRLSRSRYQRLRSIRARAENSASGCFRFARVMSSDAQTAAR